MGRITLKDRSFYLGAFVLFSSCTAPRMNTAFTREWMEFNTRYNIYFNAHESYKGALAEVESSLPQDYSMLLDLHPVDAQHREEIINEDFDYTLEKCDKALAIRSFKVKIRKNPAKMNDPKYREFLKRDEYNPFLYRVWLLMASAEYYKGELMRALATYTYVYRHFAYDRDIANEARIGMMRCYIALGWTYEAEEIDRQIQSSTHLNERLIPLFRLEEARLKYREEQYKEAISPLSIALKGKMSKPQRIRLTFALAQLYQQVGNETNAFNTYQKVIRMAPPIDVEANAYIKQTELQSVKNTRKAQSKLTSMQHNPRYAPYLDQIYYALGNIALKNRDTLLAYRHYQRAIDTSQTGGMGKALPALALGKLHFQRKEYSQAQTAYSTAVSTLRKDYPNYEEIKLLSDVLDELVVYAENVRREDSLQHLTTLPEEERLKIIQKAIEDYKINEEKKRKEAEMQKLSEERQENLNTLTNSSSSSPKNPTLTPTDHSWYFYNSSLLSQGRNDFIRIWGNRKLEDDWRRRDKTSITLYDNEEGGEENTTELSQENASTSPQQDKKNGEKSAGTSNNPTQVEYYLKDLPFSSEALANSDSIIQDGLLNMAKLYHEKLQNIPLSIETLENFLTRYPNSSKGKDVYYQLFLLGYQTDNSFLMEQYRGEILASYPDSKEATLLEGNDYMQRIQQSFFQDEILYENSYEAYLKNRMKEVQTNYEDFTKEHPLSKIMPKFMFLTAMSYVPEGNTKSFRELLRKLLTEYPQSDVSQPASEMLKQMAKGAELAKGSSKTIAHTWREQILGDTTNIEALFVEEAEKPSFDATPDSSNLLMLAFPISQVNQNQLLYDIAVYNFTTFKTLELDLEIRTSGEVGMVLVWGFESIDEVLEYKRRLLFPEAMGRKLPAVVQPIPISSKNFNLLFKSRTIEEYLDFWERSLSERIERE